MSLNSPLVLVLLTSYASLQPSLTITKTIFSGQEGQQHSSMGIDSSSRGNLMGTSCLFSKTSAGASPRQPIISPATGFGLGLCDQVRVLSCELGTKSDQKSSCLLLEQACQCHTLGSSCLASQYYCTQSPQLGNTGAGNSPPAACIPLAL